MNAKNLITLGLALLIVPNFIRGALDLGDSQALMSVFGIGAAIGMTLYIVGLCKAASAKGQSAWWGATGLLCVVGGLIVLFLPKRTVS